jgi:hypothetical protein
MNQQQNKDFPGEKNGFGAEKTRDAWKRGIRWTAALVALGSVSLAAGFETARTTMQASPFAMDAQKRTPALSVSPVRTAAEEKGTDAAIQRLPTQQQAEKLLQLAIQKDEAALNLLRQNVDGWRGRLKNTDQLFDLVLAALNSRDLRVRTAAVDVDLAANNLSKSPESVERLLRQLRNDPPARGMALWRLGSLGNRGVEPDKVLSNLLKYSQDRNEHTRYWAVEGLAMLGNDATIDPLLEALTHDPSPRVRERAANSLGEAGMLTREERLAAVPLLLNFADDDSLNATTRGLIYGTLRIITGSPIGNDADAWREWWAQHDPARQRPLGQGNIVRT